uniref:Uncharacterized protein n=1 Tax=Kalanchoe fedtschenkoi TaxID=63787 RepID=A0A7N1A7A9_KALFE
MEGERRTRQRRKPLSDCTNSNTLPFNCNPAHSCSSRTGLPLPSPVITNSKAAARYLQEPISNKKTKKILIDTSETPKKRRRKFTDPTLRSINTNEGNKENVDSNISIIPDSPSTPSVRQPLSPLDDRLTIYARRQTGKTKDKEKVVVNEAFTCPPVKRKMD